MPGAPSSTSLPRYVRPSPSSGVGSARRRLHALDAARVAVLKAVAADAPRAVVAHLAERAVGIVKPHPVVRVSLGPRHEHQTVRADRPAAVAQRPGEGRGGRFVERRGDGVEQDEVVPRAVHFGKVHAVSLPDVSDGIICRTGRKVNAKSC